MSVFQHLLYENTKTREYHSIWRKKALTKQMGFFLMLGTTIYTEYHI